MDDKIVTLTTYYDAMEAEIIRGRLEANGIDCFIADGFIIGANPLYNQAVGGIKIKIFERDMEECLAILAEDVEVDPDVEETACPNCGSTNVFYGPAPISKNWMFLIPSILLFPIYPLFLEKSWHCKNCDARFE